MVDESENPKSSSPGSSKLLRITVQSKGQESHEYVNTVHTADKSRKKESTALITQICGSRLKQYPPARDPLPPPHLSGTLHKGTKGKVEKRELAQIPSPRKRLTLSVSPRYSVSLFSAALRPCTKPQAPLLLFLLSSGVSARLRDALPILSFLPPLLLKLLLLLLLLLMMMTP
ncbi:uncharacterized [Tachysurus ichikawai]